MSKSKEIIELDGFKFYKYEENGYFNGYVNGKRIRLHRYVWEKHNGEIPKGYHIHHKDHNKFNNDISNLELISASEHEKSHYVQKTDEEKAIITNNLMNIAHPKACEWHGSKEGVEWHKSHGKSVACKLKDVKLKKTCIQCGITFYDNGFNKAKFCSNKCKSKYRRDMKLDYIERVCVVCGKTFRSNKYKDVKTCSSTCGSILSYQNRKG